MLTVTVALLLVAVAADDDGIICARGCNWYQLQYTHGTGWIAEGYGSEYWLQPAG